MNKLIHVYKYIYNYISLYIHCVHIKLNMSYPFPSDCCPVLHDSV